MHDRIGSHDMPSEDVEAWSHEVYPLPIFWLVLIHMVVGSMAAIIAFPFYLFCLYPCHCLLIGIWAGLGAQKGWTRPLTAISVSLAFIAFAVTHSERLLFRNDFSFAFAIGLPPILMGLGFRLIRRRMGVFSRLPDFTTPESVAPQYGIGDLMMGTFLAAIFALFIRCWLLFVPMSALLDNLATILVWSSFYFLFFAPLSWLILTETPPFGRLMSAGRLLSILFAIGLVVFAVFAPYLSAESIILALLVLMHLFVVGMSLGVVRANGYRLRKQFGRG